MANEENAETTIDPLAGKFLQSLDSKGGSVYTERNYRQALVGFSAWAREQQAGELDWKALRRDDFRYFLRFLGRGKLSRAAIQLRFSALRLRPLAHRPWVYCARRTLERCRAVREEAL